MSDDAMSPGDEQQALLEILAWIEARIDAGEGHPVKLRVHRRALRATLRRRNWFDEEKYEVERKAAGERLERHHAKRAGAPMPGPVRAPRPQEAAPASPEEALRLATNALREIERVNVGRVLEEISKR